VVNSLAATESSPATSGDVVINAARMIFQCQTHYTYTLYMYAHILLRWVQRCTFDFWRTWLAQIYSKTCS
jgi:hypothetical protein